MIPPSLDSAEREDRIAGYLRRIGLARLPAADPDGLKALHRRHVEAIAWENLEMQLGRPVTTDPADAYDKIVGQGRGGWCYEMNGLFAWMLELAGFRVTRLSAAVFRESLGDQVIGNHLTLLVDLDGRTWLADVGLGTGLIEPVLLAEGGFEQDGRPFALERIEGGWWRFRNQPGVMPPSFDFHPERRDAELMARTCHWLQTDPASPFWRMPVVHRYEAGTLHSLAGASAIIGEGGESRAVSVEGADAYARQLRERFGLDLADAGALWAVAAEAAARFADGVAEDPAAA